MTLPLPKSAPRKRAQSKSRTANALARRLEAQQRLESIPLKATERQAPGERGTSGPALPGMEKPRITGLK